VAAQIEADGFADAGAARLAQLGPHTEHHGGRRTTLRITLATVGLR
jgi:hypothetical protein